MYRVHERATALTPTTPTERCIEGLFPRLLSIGLISHLKDQRAGLQPHYLKCVFIGYPLDYKGWLFFDLEAKKEVILNTAVFDKWVLPGKYKLELTFY